MVEHEKQPDSRETVLRREYHGQTARIPWKELQTYYARGSVVAVASTLDLVEVAVQLGLDNTQTFEQWIAAGDVAGVNEAQAQQWFDQEAELWAVVAAPWVLVQEKRADEKT
ncbi:MAG: DUF2288 domain-containing protein [Halioglobus sp.]